MDPAISTQDLSKYFGNFAAVDRLNLEIAPGEVCAFLGPNGAGKTTAIRMLCGVLEASSGSARVLGFDLKRDLEKIKQRIGYMSQKFSLYEELTVEENLDFYAGLYGLRGRDKSDRMGEMLELSQLTGQKNATVAVLSRGYRQRLALACAIIARPALIFLDEPTSGVSPSVRRAFFDLIREMAAAGVTVIVSTHFMDEAERCDRIAFFNQGRLLALDRPSHLRETVLEGYLLELTLEEPLKQIESLRAVPGVLNCTPHGSRLHVLVEKPEDAKMLLKYSGVEPRPITPGLEDVFVALARKRESRRNV